MMRARERQRSRMMRFVFAAVALWAVGGNFARGACPPQYTQNFDSVTPPALPAGWTASQGMNLTGAPLWITSAITPDTPPNDAFSTAPDNILDNRLDTPPIFVSTNDFSGSFWHSYNLQAGFDGAVLEISNPSINGGAFTDVTDPAVGGHFDPGTGYNTTISATSQSPLAGRMAWGGNSNGYVRCGLIFGMPFQPGFFGNTIFRFRLVTDNSVASGGWRIDTFRWEHSECNPPSPTPSSPTPTPTATATPTPTAAPSPTPTPSATPVPTPTPAQALNIATRLRVETGDRMAIGGFIITGSAPKKVALRGVGPSLTNFGLSDVLANPVLELRAPDGALLGQNDNWQDDSGQAAQLMALGLAPRDPNEAGIVATLQPGAYTAMLAGKDQTSGIGLVEVYDADSVAASQLGNISTRGFVRSGNDVMIGGFILDNGSASTVVAVRGIGPSLSQFGLSNVLADPILELRDGNGTLLNANDNWQDDPFGAAQLTANGLAPQDPLESGIFTTLPPGLFTAVLAGKNGEVGLALVEVYCNLQTATRLVTSTSPSGPGSLVQTLAEANNGDTIRFDPSLYGRTIFPHLGLVIDKDIVISGFGPDHSAIAQDGHISVFIIEPNHRVLIEGVTIRGGTARDSGGGIHSEGSILIVNNCAVENNASDGTGGGISQIGARLTIINSAIRGNSTTVFALDPAGGGIHASGVVEIRKSTISGNHVGNGSTVPGLGGGIYNTGTLAISDSSVTGNFTSAGAGIANHGALRISNSTISGNTASPGFQGQGNSGGGIVNGGPLTIQNSTISGNSAALGSGILNTGSLTITQTTVSDNQAGPGSGSIHNSSGSLEIGKSILKTGSAGASIFNSSGTVISQGYNLSSDNGAGFLTALGDQINANPMLGLLQNNGGPTFTHALLPGSPAINAGDPNLAPSGSYDQRGPGYPRVIGGRIDIGSFEVQPTPTPSPTPP